MQSGEEGTSDTKSAQACLPCQARHRKCIWEEGSNTCSQCAASSIKCKKQPTWKFRADPKQKALPSASSSSWRTCRTGQVPIRFYDETDDLLAVYQVDAEAEERQQDAAHQSAPLHHQGQPSDSFSVVAIDEQDWMQTTPNSSSTQAHQPFIHTRQDSRTLSVPSLSTSEAFLLRNFTERMAQWTDIADPFRTFEFQVSRVALTDLIVRYAICAFSARHYYRCQRGESGEAEALDYQNRCLELLIPAMSVGGQMITASVLTAVALLRQNEEMDAQDNRFHLEGATRILNMVPEFTALGGIGEAACWLCLREEIYISLTMQSPIQISLECFRDSTSIMRNDDQSWASRAILNLAVLLDRAFRGTRDSTALPESAAEIAAWYAQKPTSYDPIYQKDRSRREGRFFPEIWTLTPYHAVGLQYYHIAQIVLSAVAPVQQENVLPYDYLMHAKARERQIRRHMYIVLGLAMSNERAENIWFTARHCLTVWGQHFEHPDDQAAVLVILEKWGQRSGWKTGDLVQSLRQQWHEHVQED